MLDQYIRARFDKFPDAFFHYRQAGDQWVLVGAQPLDGKIHFTTLEEGERHVQAIWKSALVTASKFPMEWAERAEKLVAEMEAKIGQKLSNSERAAIFDNASDQAEKQRESYLNDVKAIMAERRTEIGKADPDLAFNLAKTGDVQTVLGTGE